MSLKEISNTIQYLSERGFAVLRYDKRGVGANHITDQNVGGNATVNDLIHDAGNALNILAVQPEVDPQRISVIGHSEGTIIAPRVAIDNSAKVKNLILMSASSSEHCWRYPALPSGRSPFRVRYASSG